MKRKIAEWGFEELLKDKPEDVDLKIQQIASDTIVLQIKHPNDLDPAAVNRLSKWVGSLKKVLPENVFVLAHAKALDIQFQRPPIPKKLEIKLVDCKLSGDETIWNRLLEDVEKIDQIQDLLYIQVEALNCDIEFDKTKIAKQVKIGGYTPKSKEPFDPKKAKPPKGGSGVQFVEEPRMLERTLGIPSQPNSPLDDKEEEKEPSTTTETRDDKDH
jgi:hypothetical protein